MNTIDTGTISVDIQTIDLGIISHFIEFIPMIIPTSNHSICRTTTNLDLTVPVSWWKQCRSAKARVAHSRSNNTWFATFFRSARKMVFLFMILGRFWTMMIVCSHIFCRICPFSPWFSPWQTKPLWYFQEMPQLRSLWLQGNNVGREVKEFFFSMGVSRNGSTPKWMVCNGKTPFK